MLKVAVITRYFPSVHEPWQGRSAYETLRALTPHVDIHVFHAMPALRPPVEHRNGKTPSAEQHSSPSEIPVSYYTFPAMAAISRPFNGASVSRTVFEGVRSFNPDLVWGCFLYPDGDAAVRIARRLNVPAVVMALGSDINRNRDPFTTWHTKRVLRNADFVLTVSDALRRRALALGAREETTRAILNGCDASVFHVQERLHAKRELGINPATKLIVYLGRMDVKKGLRELVQAAVMLRVFRRDVHIYMVGEGPDRALIESDIDKNQADEYIHLMPPCSFDRVAQWMAASDLVTLPSYMEGCPNVILEALACGRPVVATAVGGIPEIVSEPCGRLVRPRESGDLARALLEVSDRSWEPQVISALRTRTWDKVAGELLEVFRALTADRGRLCAVEQARASSAIAG
jgi:teichuronic acid biosynthesis glycosyltransferase TuaC